MEHSLHYLNNVHRRGQHLCRRRCNMEMQANRAEWAPRYGKPPTLLCNYPDPCSARDMEARAWIGLIGSEPPMSWTWTPPLLLCQILEQCLVQSITHSGYKRMEFNRLAESDFLFLVKPAWGEKWLEILSCRPSLQIFQKCEHWLFDRKTCVYVWVHKKRWNFVGQGWNDQFNNVEEREKGRGVEVKTREWRASKRLKEEAAKMWGKRRMGFERQRQEILSSRGTSLHPCPCLSATFPQIFTAAAFFVNSFILTTYRLW